MDLIKLRQKPRKSIIHIGNDEHGGLNPDSSILPVGDIIAVSTPAAVYSAIMNVISGSSHGIFGPVTDTIRAEKCKLLLYNEFSGQSFEIWIIVLPFSVMSDDSRVEMLQPTLYFVITIEKWITCSHCHGPRHCNTVDFTDHNLKQRNIMVVFGL